MKSPPARERPPTVVVIGAGFAGLAAMGELAKQGWDAWLVERQPYTTFQPLLYQVATGGLNVEDVAFPIRSLLRRMGRGRFVQGTAVTVDWDRRLVTLDSGRLLPYDFLLLATGATPRFFGVPGAANFGLPLHTLADAVRLRTWLVDALERAAAESDRRPVHLVVVGGGPTGVETAGALAELRDLLAGRDYPELARDDIRIELLEAAPRLLPSFHPALSRYATEALERRSVVVMTGGAVRQVREGEVLLDSGPRPVELLVWSAGVEVSDSTLLRGLARTTSGRLLVNPSLQLPGRPEVLALGDVSGARAGAAELPQLAQPAIQAGRHAVRQLQRMRSGQRPRPFRYRDRGTMATIGRRAAVAQLRGGLRLTGTAAWLAWLALHLVELLGVRNRASVLINWTWHYLAWRRAAGLIPPAPAGARQTSGLSGAGDDGERGPKSKDCD